MADDQLQRFRKGQEQLKRFRKGQDQKQHEAIKAEPVEEEGPSFLDQAAESLGDFAENIGESVSFGLTTPLQAGIGKLIEGGWLDPTKSVDEQLRKQGVNIEDKYRTYGELVEQADKRQDVQFERSPISSYGGQAVGLLMPGVAAAKGAKLGLKAVGKGPVKSLLKAVGKKGTKAALLGGEVAAGVTGAGLTGFLERPEGEEVPFTDIEGRTEQMKTAAPYGVAGPLIGRTAGAIAKGTKAGGRALVLKSLGLKKSTFNKITKKGSSLSRPDDITDELIKRNLVRAGDTIEDIFKRVEAEISKVGKEIGRIYKEADEFVKRPEIVKNFTGRQKTRFNQTALNSNNLGARILGDLQKKFKGTAFETKIKNAIEEPLRSLQRQIAEDGGEISMEALQKYRRSLDDLINYSQAPGDNAVNDAFRTIRNTLKKASQERIDFLDSVVRKKALPGPGHTGKALPPKVSELRKLNKSYQNLADGKAVGVDGVASAKGNRFAGLTSQIVGSGLGGTIGGLPGAVLGFGAVKLGEKYGPSFGPAIAKGSQSIVQNSPAIGFASSILGARQSGPSRSERRKKALRGKK